MFSYFLLSLFFISSFQSSDSKSVPRSFGALEYKTVRLYRFKGIPNFNKTRQNEKRELYHYEQTIIVRDTDVYNKVLHCEILEVYQEVEAMEVLAALSSILDIKVKKVYMNGMMKLMNECDAADNSVKYNYVEEEIIQRTARNVSLYASTSEQIFSGIYPGTNWCGFGDIANSYHDLGNLRNVDRCCRAHDLCPIKILGKDTRYNLSNNAIYTKTHCICDTEFYNCLKRDNGWTAKLLGNLYFYVASPQCVKGLPELIHEGPITFIPALNKW